MKFDIICIVKVYCKARVYTMEDSDTSGAFPSKTCTGLRVFFIGPRGAGKSATINTIIGRDVAESTSSLRKESTTKKMNKYLVENQNVVLVDTPALRRSIIKELKKEFRKSDILAFVIAAQRLQMEDETCILMVLKDLKYLHSRSFILLTRGSNIVDDSNVFNPESNKELYQLYEAVDKRYVVFENRNKTEKERKLCIDKFLSMSREISFNEEIKIETLRENYSKVSGRNIVIQSISWTVIALAIVPIFISSAKNINVLRSVATNDLYTTWCCHLSLIYDGFQSMTWNGFQNFLMSGLYVPIF
ncbi:GTPase IMAP family member 8-like [Crassostrea angulata]|uniref:GTPase IMAP family member 8-like n=1 Tax=Magallana angulata TaxID=2784310 RepID=UPI0022B0BFB3|nr:GTPase IMAP family member 8-like [Crassostrea angulata]